MGVFPASIPWSFFGFDSLQLEGVALSRAGGLILFLEFLPHFILFREAAFGVAAFLSEPFGLLLFFSFGLFVSLRYLVLL